MSFESDHLDSVRAGAIGPGTRKAIVFLGCLTVSGGLLRAANWGNWDWETLLFLIGGGIILLLPSAVSIKLGKDGLEIQLPSSVKELGVGGKIAEPSRSTEKANTGSLTNMLELAVPALGIKHPGDPQKEMWGGKEVNNDRRLSATVKPLPGSLGWYAVTLVVSSTNVSKPLTGEVVFHLHPTFRKSVVTVVVKDRVAELEIVAWGAFTVGAECDGGATRLELDLATLPDAPPAFRSQ